MQTFSLPCSLSLLILAWLFSPNVAAILTINRRSAESNGGSLESRGDESTNLEAGALRLNGGSRIGAGPDYMDPLRYRISRSGQTIIFSHWGNELPNFDDVISALDKAEVELEEEVQRRGYDENMGKIRGWNFQTAHVVVRNDKGPDGMNHRELLSFLNGLRLFGQQYGFWTCEMELYNERYTQRTRGQGVLEVAPPPRAEAVAEA